jgi:hypothetical protein
VVLDSFEANRELEGTVGYGYVVGINIAVDVAEQAYMIYPFCTT